MPELLMAPVWIAVRGADAQMSEALSTGAPLSHFLPPPALFSPAGRANWQRDTWGAAAEEATATAWDAPHGAIGLRVDAEKEMVGWAMAVARMLDEGAVIEIVSLPVYDSGERHALLTGISARGIETAINCALVHDESGRDLAPEREAVRQAFEIYGYGDLFPMEV